MKKILLITALLMCTLVVLFMKQYDPGQEVSMSKMPGDTPKTKSPTSHALDQAYESLSPEPNGIDLEQMIEAVRAISRKALPSKDESEALNSLLSDKHLQDKLFATLSSGDRLPFDIANERDRMEMVGLLSMMVNQKNLDGRQSIINRAVERIVSVDFNSMKDLKQKQSIFGDVVEMMKVLKRLEPEAYENVRSTIAGSHEKALNHALFVAG
ncbi:MAG: hypothetical protein M3Q07_15645 [Pseudobdellovibrionaceae bacterium]|nr:hypothetical protein [Pseudobdellovibrionaceae bacterium]